MIARKKFDQLRENLTDPLSKIIEETYIECKDVTTLDQCAVVESRLQDIRSLIEKDRSLIESDYAIANKAMSQTEKDDVRSYFLAELKKSEGNLKQIEDKLKTKSLELSTYAISNEIKSLEQNIQHLTDVKPNQESIRQLHNNIIDIKSRISALQEQGLSDEAAAQLQTSLSQSQSEFDTYLKRLRDRFIQEKVEDLQLEIKHIGIKLNKRPRSDEAELELKNRIQKADNDLIELKRLAGNSSEIRAMTASIVTMQWDLNEYGRGLTNANTEYEAIKREAKEGGNIPSLNLRVQKVFKELNDLKTIFGNSPKLRTLTAQVAELGAELKEHEKSQKSDTRHTRKPGS